MGIGSDAVPTGTPGWCGVRDAALERWARVRCACGAGWARVRGGIRGIGDSPVPKCEGPVAPGELLGTVGEPAFVREREAGGQKQIL